jgi:sugar phosphate isomerase/epimerase
MQKRRTFIKTTSAALLTAMVIPNKMWAKKKNKVIGIQLYTLREMLKENFEETLEIIASIGYSTIEAAGYADRKFYGYYPKEYKNILNDFGLIPVSSHAKFTVADAPYVIEDTLESGANYLVYPWLAENQRKTIDDYKQLAGEFNIIGELCKKEGLTFAYHNHAFEFEEMNGVIPYNVLLENTEPDLVSMELDLYWIMRGGFNPKEYFEIFQGRFKLWHVKDMTDTSEMDFAPVGQGILNFQAIFRLKELAGLEYAFVEQDSHSNDDPILNIQTSFKYLNRLSDY